eukprot:scaffold1995_cov167-Amphora_coffeaeformis.AAC.2
MERRIADRCSKPASEIILNRPARGFGLQNVTAVGPSIQLILLHFCCERKAKIFISIYDSNLVDVNMLFSLHACSRFNVLEPALPSLSRLVAQSVVSMPFCLASRICLAFSIRNIFGSSLLLGSTSSVHALNQGQQISAVNRISYSRMNEARGEGLVADDVGGVEFPVEDAVILKKGLSGNLYSISLSKDSHEGSRPGEDPIQYERILNLESPRTSALSLYRFKVWWLRPCWGTKLPLETILLLDQPTGDTGNYRLVLAVPLPVQFEGSSMAFASSSLRGSPSNIVLCSNRPCTGLYSGEGHDPYALIQEGVQFAASVWYDDDDDDDDDWMHLFSTKSPLCRTLGWCSWNAFYTDVTGTKVIDAVHKLQTKHCIPIRWIILDDGWQDTTTPHHSLSDGEQWSHRLTSIKEDPIKFADLNLKDTVQKLKSDCHIEAVLVWHTLVGYWLGLDESSFDVDLQFPSFPRGIVDNDWSVSREASVSKGIGLPKDPFRFFQYCHDYFISCGVDGVKVDAQGVIGTLRSKQIMVGAAASSAVLSLQSALAQSPIQKVDCATGTIHCMAHAPEIFFRLPSLSNRQALAPLFRAADDFYPDNQASHAAQVVACAFNSLLFRILACPDYDMFSTNLIAGENSVRMHAIARCLSGGTIYISDAPESLPNKEVISWLCCSDGSTLPCRDSAVPIRRCLLHDPLNESESFGVTGIKLH